jgi:hypothetical protein
VDSKADAIAELQRSWPSVDARVVDLEQDATVIEPDRYDLIVCWLYFQRELYPLIRDAVRPGGIAALSALLQGRFAAEPGELRSYFADWEVLHDAVVEHGPAKSASQVIVRRPK